MGQATRYLCLPFEFDVSRLQNDVLQLRNVHWLDHYNNQAHEKSWTCLPLRSLEGRIDNIFAQSDGDFRDTEMLMACPYFQYVLAQFQCQTTSVRLMSMQAGGRILPHRDAGGGYEDGVARLHIPIFTTPDVVFFIDGERIHFSAGKTWYMNANCVHAVENNSTQERIHLVLDCVPNLWLTTIFEAAGWQKNAAPKYGDPNINDDNVSLIIMQLQTSGQPAALQMAQQLSLIQQGCALANAD